MFAYKDIFAKPSITQAHKVRKGRSPRLALARLAAFIIPCFLSFFNRKINTAADFSAASIYVTSDIRILSFLRRKTYATSDTRLSNAFPMPNSNAIPVSVGVHTPVA